MIEALAYSLAEAAEAVGIAKSTLRAAIADGQLKARRNGMHLLILVSDLNEYLRSLPAVKD